MRIPAPALALPVLLLAACAPRAAVTPTTPDDTPAPRTEPKRQPVSAPAPPPVEDPMPPPPPEDT